MFTNFFNSPKLIKRGIIYSSLIILIIIIVLQSCYKDKFNFDNMTTTQLNANWAVPVVKSTLTMADLIDETSATLKEDQDHFLTLVYTNRILSELGNEMIEIPDEIIDTTIYFSYPINLPPGDSTTESYVYTQAFNTPNNEIIDSVYIKSGTFHFYAKGDMNHNGKVVVTIPGIRNGKDGRVFQDILKYDYKGTEHTIVDTTYDLSGYIMKLVHMGGNNNQLKEYVSITGYSDTLQDKSPYKFETTKSLKDIEYTKVFGYFGQYDYNFDIEKLRIKMFEEISKGMQILEDPKFNLIFRNSYGMPIQASFVEFTAHKDPVEIPITGPGLQNINVNYPYYYQIGQEITTIHTLDKNNSNVKDAFNINPKYINYQIDAKSNPTGVVTQNFALETSSFIVDLEAELPLYGRGWGFVLQDTNDFNFEEDIGDIEEIESVEFRINANNGFPTDGTVQVYFTDTNYVLLDSLLNPLEQLINTAIPGGPPTYRVLEKTNKTTSIIYDRARLEKIKNTMLVITKAEFSTVNNGGTIVKIYSDYGIDVKVGVKAKVNVDL